MAPGEPPDIARISSLTHASPVEVPHNEDDGRDDHRDAHHENAARAPIDAALTRQRIGLIHQSDTRWGALLKGRRCRAARLGCGR